MKMLLDKLREWQQRGYVSANVWESMEDVVDPNLLPVREVPSSGQGDIMNAMCNSVVKIWPTLCAGNPLKDLGDVLCTQPHRQKCLYLIQ